MKKETKREKRQRRHKKVKAKIRGNFQRPRLCVFRSLKHIYAQIIGKVLASVSDLKMAKEKSGESKTERAKEVGKLIAQKAKEKKIEKVVFDRAGYKYHGRVKALAETARQGGLKF